MKTLILTALALSALTFQSCRGPGGPAERTGRTIDRGVERTGDTLERGARATGRTVERTGDRIERTVR